MRDTDATGVIYFTSQLEMGLEAFEAYLRSKKVQLQDIITKKNFLFPIVHTKADFFAPITLGQELEIRWQVREIGKKSFTHESLFFFEEKRVGSTTIIHATIEKDTHQTIPVPDSFIELLKDSLGAIGLRRS